MAGTPGATRADIKEERALSGALQSRCRRAFGALRSVCAAVLLAVAPASLAQVAQEDPAARARALQRVRDQGSATLEFVLLVIEATAEKKPELLDGEDAQQMLGIITDHKELLEDPYYAHYGAEDIDRLTVICQNALEAAKMLVTVDLPPVDFGREHDSAYRQSIEEHVWRNRHRHAAKLAKLDAFIVRCTVPVNALMERVVAGLKPEEVAEKERLNIAQIRQQSAFFIEKTLESLFNEEKNPALVRQALSVAIADTAASFAGTMDLEQRKAILGHLNAAIARADPENRAVLERATAAYADTRCEAVCRF